MEEFGHVFVVRGNLLSLACDAIVVPTDAYGKIETPWIAHLQQLDGLEVQGGRVRVEGAGGHEPLTVLGPFSPSGTSPTPSERQTWLLATGVLPETNDVVPGDERWRGAIAELQGVLRQFSHEFKAHRQQQGSPMPSRGCPLVGVPLLGSSSGGFGPHFRQYAAELLVMLREVARAGEFDVALVIYGSGRRPAASEALCRLERQKHGFMPTEAVLAERWKLGARAPKSDAAVSTRSVATGLRHLMDKAGSGELIPFFGAGVSRSAGAADWADLIGTLEQEAGLSELVSGRLDLLSRAQIIENTLGKDALLSKITELLGKTPVALQHLLLASLGARDAITTNFDDAYERAVNESGRGVVAVVPRPGSDLRLLKLHGSLQQAPAPGPGEPRRGGNGGDRSGTTPVSPPILTRDQFLEHSRHNGPLRGALQMMLLTGHVMFIGYSLSDPDLHEAIHEVRRIREQAGIPDDAPLATAVQVGTSQELGYLWSPFVSVLWPSADDARTASDGDIRPRELEILLDVLSDAANLTELPVLAFRDSELTDPWERELREALEKLSGLFDGPDLPRPIAELRATYGATGSTQVAPEQ